MSLTEEQKVFRFPKSFKWIALVCAIAFLAFLALCLALPFIEPEDNATWIITVLGLALVLPLTVFSIRAYRLHNDYILVENTSITYVSDRKGEIRFEWSEVHRIRERIILQRLELHDLFGTKVIKLEYQLDNFEGLRELILKNTEHLSASQDHVFHRTIAAQITYLVILVIFGGMAWLAIRQSEAWAAWAFLGFNMLVLIELLFRDIRTVTPNLDHVSIKYLLRERSVPYSQIVGVDLRNTPDGRGNELASVLLELENGKTIKLQGFKDGSMSLYRSLKQHWEQAREYDARGRTTTTKVI